ncbi:hypothetical protein KKC60_01660 [Patescibacteria group bacterium]|nr:hypothetical protein [Patescibacteria group bacterium]
MKRRNLIIIISICVLVVAIGVYAYFALTKTEETTDAGLTTPVVGTEDVSVRLSSEEVQAGKTRDKKESEIVSEQNPRRAGMEDVQTVTIRKILSTEILKPTMSKDLQKILFFNKELEEFYQINPDGSNEESISSAGFNNVFDLSWGLSKDRAIIYFSGDQGISKRLIAFNLNDQSYNNLGDNVTDAALSPNGEKIVYLYTDQEKGVSNISTANFDGSKWKIVYPFDQNEVSLSWPDAFRFFVSGDATSYGSGSLYEVDTEGGDFKTLVGDVYGLSYKVSPDGKKVIYTASSEPRAKELYLYVTDIEGKEHKDLDIATMTEKCTFAQDNRTVYCAVPKKGNQDFVLPDDYNDEKYITADSFYRIDTETGVKEKLADVDDFSSMYDAVDPFISESGRTMYFKRRQDNMLYALIVPAN